MKYPHRPMQFMLVASLTALSGAAMAQMTGDMPKPTTPMPSMPATPPVDPKPAMPDPAPPATIAPAPAPVADMPACSKTLKTDCMTKSGKMRHKHHHKMAV
jgi:hypothetical protein